LLATSEVPKGEDHIYLIPYIPQRLTSGVQSRMFPKFVHRFARPIGIWVPKGYFRHFQRSFEAS